MRRSVIETIMGGVVLVVAGLFLYFVYSSSRASTADGYELIARFNRVDGLANGSDVRMSGIKVGSVVRQMIDPKTYRAIVHFTVNSSIQLPADTSARIQSDGLLGQAYMMLEPGGAEEMLKPGGEVEYTQDAVNLVDLLGRFIFSGGGPGTSGGQPSTASNPAPAPPAANSPEQQPAPAAPQ
jgi:phospholipid/cholesterol/gamma-HCH transport system substrate-binding protein